MVRVVFSVAAVLAVPAGAALSLSCAASAKPEAPAPAVRGTETDGSWNGLADCEVDELLLRPTTLSRSDQCELRMRCGSAHVRVACDGENDGTETSLCDCERNGVLDRHALKPLYQGEAPASCLAAAPDCRAAALAASP